MKSSLGIEGLTPIAAARLFVLLTASGVVGVGCGDHLDVVVDAAAGSSDAASSDAARSAPDASAQPSDASTQVSDAAVGLVDAATRLVDAAPAPDAGGAADAGGTLGVPATPVPMPGLAVRDFALVGNQIVAVVVNDQARVDVVACPGAGCSGAALILAANEPAGVLAIEADALRAYWTTDQTIEQVSLDGQDRDVRFDLSVVGGEVQQALLREDGFVYFAAYNNLNNRITIRRIDSTQTQGTTSVANLGPAVNGRAIMAIGGGGGHISMWFDPFEPAATNPIRVKPVAAGAAVERADVVAMRGTNSLAVAQGGVFWVENPLGSGPDLLRVCSMTGACVPVTLFDGVTSAITTDGVKIFFSTVLDQHALLMSCDAAEAIAAGTCTPTVLSEDLCWLGARRLRATPEFIYGVSQVGALCRVAR